MAEFEPRTLKPHANTLALDYPTSIKKITFWYILLSNFYYRCIAKLAFQMNCFDECCKHCYKTYSFVACHWKLSIQIKRTFDEWDDIEEIEMLLASFTSSSPTSILTFRSENCWIVQILSSIWCAPRRLSRNSIFSKVHILVARDVLFLSNLFFHL